MKPLNISQNVNRQDRRQSKMSLPWTNKKWNLQLIKWLRRNQSAERKNSYCTQNTIQLPLKRSYYLPKYFSIMQAHLTGPHLQRAAAHYHIIMVSQHCGFINCQLCVFYTFNIPIFWWCQWGRSVPELS